MIQYSKLDEDLLKKHEVINRNDKKTELAKARKKRFNKKVLNKKTNRERKIKLKLRIKNIMQVIEGEKKK